MSQKRTRKCSVNLEQKIVNIDNKWELPLTSSKKISPHLSPDCTPLILKLETFKHISIKLIEKNVENNFFSFAAHP